MASDSKFQDLPPSKYPRSYSPRFRSDLMLRGAQSNDGTGIVIDDAIAGQGARDAMQSRDTNIQAGEKSLMQQRRDAAQKRNSKPLGSFKHGGKVKRTGIYKLHKGETVARSKGGRMRSR